MATIGLFSAPLPVEPWYPASPSPVGVAVADVCDGGDQPEVGLGLVQQVSDIGLADGEEVAG